MKNSKQLKEQIAALFDKAEAITAIATEEKRDATDQEKADIDGIMGIGNKDDDNYVSGAIDALEIDLARIEKLEAKQAELAKSRTAPLQDGGKIEPKKSSIIIPAVSRYRTGTLKAYKGDKADENAYCMGQFLIATIFNNDRSPGPIVEKAIKFCREKGVGIFGAQGTNDNALGGFTVPDEMDQAIIDLRERFGVFRREARVNPMASDTKDLLRRAGGLTAYFGDENPSSAMTQSEKTWDQVKLVARKLYTLTLYSTEISEDSIIDIADDLTSEIAFAFAEREDDCGFNGDGTSTYGGITGLKEALLAGSSYEALSGNTAFSTLDSVDFESMVGKLPTYAESNAKWYISKAGYAASMLRLIDAAGGNTIQTLEAGATQRRFLGYDVVISQKMNTTLAAQTSTEGLVYFGDLRQAADLGNRRGVTVRLSEDRYFDTDQIAIRGTERFDINVHETGTADDAGSIIKLDTPSS